MAYTSKDGNRPFEYASKISHTHIINDPTVSEFLRHGDIPKKAADVIIPEENIKIYKPASHNPITQIIAIDGGFEEIPVQTEFPSSKICFFQFGILAFSINDLETINDEPFIQPEDIAKLKQIERIKFTLPVNNFSYKEEPTITHSVRRAVYDFFSQKNNEDKPLNDTLKWFIFREYSAPLPSWNLSSCPYCFTSDITLERTKISKDYTFTCPACNGEIFLTDVFRLHEAIDDNLGAGGIFGYVTTTFEQILLVHVIRLILNLKPSLLNSVFFIKDGPLAFFGQTANMHKPMRNLINYLFDFENLYLAGLEKSGPFVEHANQISEKLEPGTILLLNNDYIYKYVIPGKADPNNPYGRTTYYGNKLIFKSKNQGVHVITVPTTSLLSNPSIEDLRNLQVILTNVEKLKCDMYDNALMPVALANKLISLSQYPSSKILQRFATTEILDK